MSTPSSSVLPEPGLPLKPLRGGGWRPVWLTLAVLFIVGGVLAWLALFSGLRAPERPTPSPEAPAQGR